MLLMTFARRDAMLCRRQGGDAVPHMTKRRTCYAVDDVCKERCYVMRRRGGDAVPLMTKKKKICYADDDCEKMCYATQKARKRCCAALTKRRICYADDDARSYAVLCRRRERNGGRS